MEKINSLISDVQRNLSDIFGQVLSFDLSGDQISTIYDKKADVIAALYRMKDKINESIQ